MMKAEHSRLISRKLAENLELFIEVLQRFTQGVAVVLQVIFVLCESIYCVIYRFTLH